MAARRLVRGCGDDPARVDLVGKSGHPIVGEQLAEPLPHNYGQVAAIGHGHEDVRTVGGEALAAHPARAQDDRATIRKSMQTNGRDHGLVQAVGSAVGLDFVADLNRGIDSHWRGASEDCPVS